MGSVRGSNPDSNRQTQMKNALEAYYKGYRKAKRHNSPGACSTCRRANGEVIDIMIVVFGQADHKNGHCYFTYST